MFAGHLNGTGILDKIVSWPIICATTRDARNQLAQTASSMGVPIVKSITSWDLRVPSAKKHLCSSLIDLLASSGISLVVMQKLFTLHEVR